RAGGSTCCTTRPPCGSKRRCYSIPASWSRMCRITWRPELRHEPGPPRDQSVTVQLLWRAIRARWLGDLAALAAVALVSGFIGLVLREVNLANVSMLYLLAVLATAVAYGRGPAVFASIVAFLTFDWFFVDPIHHFTVSDPEEWVSLLFFLVTAIVT